MQSIRHWVAILAACLGWAFASSSAAVAETTVDKSGLRTDSGRLALGAQPIGIPSGVVSGVMARDRIMRAELERAGAPLAVQAFIRGADIVPLLADGRLKAGLLGDMPTLMATSFGDAVIVGLVKQTSTAIVSRGLDQVRDLAGKRIGYVEGSSAHHTLLQGLVSGGLRESQVTLVPMSIDELPEALDKGRIEAFSGWEPAPTLALQSGAANKVIFRGRTADYLVLNRGFVEQKPREALILIAGFVRAIEWMRRSRGNLEKAAVWQRLDAEAFTGKPVAIPIEQAVRITREEIIDVPSAPAIPGKSRALPLRGEFDFLARFGKLPAGADWAHVDAAFRYEGLAQVLENPARYRIHEVDYAD